MIIVTPEQMKYLEAEADRNGNTYEMLMEKAGERLAEKIISIINIEKNKDKNHIFDIIFLCGNGNNAGDCFVKFCVHVPEAHRENLYRTHRLQ